MRKFVLLAAFALALAAVPFALCRQRPAAGDWQATKDAVRQWVVENDAYTERLRTGQPRDLPLESELGVRISVLLRKYERERRW